MRLAIQASDGEKGSCRQPAVGLGGDLDGNLVRAALRRRAFTEFAVEVGNQPLLAEVFEFLLLNGHLAIIAAPLLQHRPVDVKD